MSYVTVAWILYIVLAPHHCYHCSHIRDEAPCVAKDGLDGQRCGKELRCASVIRAISQSDMFVCIHCGVCVCVYTCAARGKYYMYFFYCFSVYSLETRSLTVPKVLCFGNAGWPVSSWVIYLSLPPNAVVTDMQPCLAFI